MHKALYREYRPLTFEDVIGQDYIVRTIKNQIKDNSLSHAYLFCGTRGTGKTSTAKILSRAVNCISKEENKPCNKCEICKGILNGSNLDVIEIDAASNNSVDDIRELRENVKYTPSNSKYKVYIIDEVHMLTQGAFNALLKTLEEPPDFVIFILATTEPNKIPATILSRCQRFDFKRVDINTLVERMEDICKREGIDVEKQALRIIARNGQGSVRDSLSILDKCVSFGENEIKSNDVLEILGSCDSQQLFRFSKSIMEGNICEAIKIIDEYFMWGKELSVLVQDVTSFFRSLMMAKVFGSTEDILDFSTEDATEILELSRNIEMEEIIRILSILSELANVIKQSTNQRLTFEIYIMKIASPSTDKSNESLVSRLNKLEKMVEDGRINIIQNMGSVQYIQNNDGKIDDDSQIHTRERKPESHDMDKFKSQIGNYEDQIGYEHLDTKEESVEIKLVKNNWSKLLERMEKDGKKPMKVFLTDVQKIENRDKKIIVALSDGYTFAIPILNKEDSKNYIQNILNELTGLNYELEFVVESEFEKTNQNIESQTETFLKDKLGDILNIE